MPRFDNLTLTYSTGQLLKNMGWCWWWRTTFFASYHKTLYKSYNWWCFHLNLYISIWWCPHIILLFIYSNKHNNGIEKHWRRQWPWVGCCCVSPSVWWPGTSSWHLLKKMMTYAKKNLILHYTKKSIVFHTICIIFARHEAFFPFLMTWQDFFFFLNNWNEFKVVNNTTRLLNGWVNWCTKMLVSTITSWKEPPTPNAYSALNIFRKIYVKMISRKHHEMQW